MSEVNRFYVLAVDGQDHHVQAKFVLPWLAGFLVGMARRVDLAQMARQIEAEMNPISAETHDQICYRVLKTCHDRGALVYRGMITDQQETR
jgi:hypothetical protein